MAAGAVRRDRTHYLYIAVIVAVVLGIAVGLAAPEFATELKPLGTGFVNLIKMMISPIIFCTIVLGIGSVRKAAKVGAVGGIALGYFMVMSLVALAIGLVVGNILNPGDGLAVTDAVKEAGQGQVGEEAKDTVEFLLGIIPTTIVSAFTSGEVLQTLLVALLAGFALQAMGSVGEPVLRGVEHIQRLVFRILAMVMWAAPIGAFGAIAAVTGSAGLDALKSLAVLMLGFYVTCFLFIFVVLGALLRIVAGLNILTLLKYLGREFLLILSTSSSESALPRLIAKMEHLGVSKPVVGITVPTGYSFNLDGTMIYMTMASLFIAETMGDPMSIGEQIPLLLFLFVASKGAAGVSGAGLATLAGGLQSHRPELVDGVGLIVGIDRFMSEARALTNFAGNAVATVLIGTWTKEIDKVRVDEVLAGRIPFDEQTLLDDGHGDSATTATALPPRTRTASVWSRVPPPVRRSSARSPGTGKGPSPRSEGRPLSPHGGTPTSPVIPPGGVPPVPRAPEGARGTVVSARHRLSLLSLPSLLDRMAVGPADVARHDAVGDAALQLGVVPRVEEVPVEGVTRLIRDVGPVPGAGERQPAAVHRPGDQQLQARHDDRMRGRTGLSGRVRHVVAVVGAVQVPPVPAGGKVQIVLQLRAGRAVHEVPAGLRPAHARPACGRVLIGRGGGGVADHVPQAAGMRDGTGVVGDALVVDGDPLGGHRGSVLVEGGRPVRGEVHRRRAVGGAGGQGLERRGRVRRPVPVELVDVRAARLSGEDDRVVTPAMAGEALRAELAPAHGRRRLRDDGGRLRRAEGVVVCCVTGARVARRTVVVRGPGGR